ncbi:TPA: hypothetical protein KDY47_003240 [Vibrio parahaemolyticus]|nr:hypothetical protein [Vibrio parahaemolyticus]
MMSIIKSVLSDLFKRKVEFEPGSVDYEACEEQIDTALKAAKRCEQDTYNEFKEQ